jgi:hypothetical protein
VEDEEEDNRDHSLAVAGSLREISQGKQHDDACRIVGQAEDTCEFGMLRELRELRYSGVNWRRTNGAR